MRRVFFSFHYADNWRVQNVMNSQVVRPDGFTPQFSNPQEWEEVKHKSPAAIKRWIKSQMHGTSVTVVLIGAETAKRPYVLHEIQESLNDCKGLLGIHIHNIKSPSRRAAARGPNPLKLSRFGMVPPKPGWFSPRIVRPYDYYDTYDWVKDDGRNNIGDWIEEAAEKADR